MAYVVQKPKQDQMQSGPQAAPTLSGGSPMAQPIAKSAAATDSGGAAKPMMQPQAQSPGMQPMQNAGRSGRFTNLQTILGQNQGLGAQISKAGQTQLGAARTAFNTAAQPLRDANFTANTNWQPSVDYLSSSGVYRTITPDAQQQAQTMANLQSMLSQQYTGPGAMNFDLQGNKNLQNAAALGNATTAGTQLAVGPYSGSANRLDQAMFGGSGEARGSMKALNSERKGFVKQASGEQEALNNKVTGFNEQAAAAREAVRNGLLGYGNSTLADINNRVAERNAQERADYDSRVVRDPNTGQVVGVPQNQQLGIWEGPSAGTGANAANMATGEERRRFAALSQLLGVPDFNIGSGGPYASGRWTTQDGPAPDLVLGNDQSRLAADLESQRHGRGQKISLVPA